MEIACFNRFELGLTRDDVDLCSHSGSCDNDVLMVSQKEYVIEQFNRIDKDAIRAELKEYGAWDEEELADHKENCLRIIWLGGVIFRKNGNESRNR